MGTEIDTYLGLAAGLATSMLWTGTSLFFTAAARRLRYSTVGLLQYTAPSLQFALAVLVYGEAFTRAHLILFACVWAALLLYSADSIRAHRRQAAVVDTPAG